jgi:hypothetical protein
VQNVFAAGDLDQFGDPADAADQWIVPFLEIDFWRWQMPRDRRDCGKPLLIHGCKLIRSRRRTDQRAQGADHRQNACDIALIEYMDGNAGTDQVGDDFGLQVGERENEVGFEREDLRNIRRDKRRDPRFLASDPRRAHRVAGDADDAILLAQQIQCLDGLLGETDDPAGRELAHGERYEENTPSVTPASKLLPDLTLKVIASTTFE